jgi:hypothetical protein
MQCNNCNQELVEGSEFCGNCGAKIINTQPQNVYSNPQQPNPNNNQISYNSPSNYSGVPPIVPAQAPQQQSATNNQYSQPQPVATPAPMPQAYGPPAPAPIAQPMMATSTFSQAPTGAYAVPKTASNGFSITSLILGIISLMSFLLFFISIPLAILAIIFGIIGITKGSKAMAIAGIVTAVIAIIATVVIILIGLSYCQNNPYDPECSDYKATFVISSIFN